jgi:transcription antitermination factor NusG
MTETAELCLIPRESEFAESSIPLENSYPWYGLRIRQRFREDCENYLKAHAYDFFSPTRSEMRQWSDRRKITQVPLFPGYLFCRFDCKESLPIWHAPGLIDIVSSGGKLLEVDAEQIANVRRCLEASVAINVIPELVCGRKVQVIAGPLAGISGVLALIKHQLRVALEITMMNRTVLVEVHASHLAPI